MRESKKRKRPSRFWKKIFKIFIFGFLGLFVLSYLYFELQPKYHVPPNITLQQQPFELPPNFSLFDVLTSPGEFYGSNSCMIGDCDILYCHGGEIILIDDSDSDGGMIRYCIGKVKKKPFHFNLKEKKIFFYNSEVVGADVATFETYSNKAWTNVSQNSGESQSCEFGCSGSSARDKNNVYDIVEENGEKVVSLKKILGINSLKL